MKFKARLIQLFWKRKSFFSFVCVIVWLNLVLVGLLTFDSKKTQTHYRQRSTVNTLLLMMMTSVELMLSNYTGKCYFFIWLFVWIEDSSVYCPWILWCGTNFNRLIVISIDVPKKIAKTKEIPKSSN